MPFSTRPHRNDAGHAPRPRRGHILTEALVATTVLLVGSTMVAQAMLTVMRSASAWSYRANASDALDRRLSLHWAQQCADAGAAAAAAEDPDAGVRVSEQAHPALGMAGAVVHARWRRMVTGHGTVGADSVGADSVAMTASTGHWCPP